MRKDFTTVESYQSNNYFFLHRSSVELLHSGSKVMYLKCMLLCTLFKKLSTFLPDNPVLNHLLNANVFSCSENAGLKPA